MGTPPKNIIQTHSKRNKKSKDRITFGISVGLPIFEMLTYPWRFISIERVHKTVN
jgi:hypothetical protein